MAQGYVVVELGFTLQQSETKAPALRHCATRPVKPKVRIQDSRPQGGTGAVLCLLIGKQSTRSSGQTERMN